MSVWLPVQLAAHGCEQEYADDIRLVQSIHPTAGSLFLGVHRWAAWNKKALTHCGSVMPYGDIDLGQDWLSYWQIIWDQQHDDKFTPTSIASCITMISLIMWKYCFLLEVYGFYHITDILKVFILKTITYTYYIHVQSVVLFIFTSMIWWNALSEMTK